MLVKIALIVNRVFFKTLSRSVKTNFMTKGHGQGVLKRKNYCPQVSVAVKTRENSENMKPTVGKHFLHY